MPGNINIFQSLRPLTRFSRPQLSAAVPVYRLIRRRLSSTNTSTTTMSDQLEKVSTKTGPPREYQEPLQITALSEHRAYGPSKTTQHILQMS